VKGFIANTDFDWFTVLSQVPEVEEVNFWRPSPRVPFKALQRGEPFFFRLKAPHHAIGGFGLYDRYEALQVWLAWDAFGVKNGARSFGELRARLEDLRARNRIEQAGELRLGCIMVVQPVFFEPDEWVRLPNDWHVRTQFGKGYDLDIGEGKRVWRECLERALARKLPPVIEIEENRYGDPVPVRPRLGQGTFRIAVMQAYRGACAITTEHSLPALEAAHIQPFAEGGRHEVRNGLFLRSDLHRLFDRGYVTVTPDCVFRVGDRLREDYANGHTYYPLNGRRLVLPGALEERPARELLAWHGERVFLG
jgi:putative restriction endonuclease